MTGIVSTAAATAGSLAKSGYAFAGWNTAANGSGTSYLAGATVNLSGNTTLYAQWTLNVYNLTYAGNGSDGGSAPATVTGVATSTVASPGSLSKTYSTFLGWNTAANGSGTSFSQGDTISLSSNVTLYAQWSANSYTVSYQSNGATSGTAPNLSSSSTGTITLALNVGLLKRDGYDFSGWNTQSDGRGTSYAAGATIALTANLTLYASWKEATPPPKFQIASLSKRKFDTAGGSLEVTGTDLTLVEYAAIDGDKLTIAYSSDAKIVLLISTQSAGKKDLVFESKNQKWTYQDAIEFVAPNSKIIANVKTKNGKVSADAINQILLEARRNRIYTDIQLSFLESDTSRAKVGSVTVLDNLQLILLARQIVNLVNHQIGVSVQVKANTSQIVLTFSVK